MRIAHERVRAQVPATSANLGPGFDSFGLALELRDEYELEVTTGEVEITVEGEGADDVPRGDAHLVVQSLRAALDHIGAAQVGIRLHCTNRIPHGRGLGSSAAAVVGGIVLARALLADPSALDEQEMLQLATDLEGHPDNAAPALLGGVTLSYLQGGRAHAERLRVGTGADGSSILDPVIISPAAPVATSTARSLLPEEVPFADAAFNLSRAALFVHAIAEDPSLLLTATQDRLHQERRQEAMPQSVALVQMLRQEGVPAVISGAGPTVLIPAGAPRHLVRLVRDMVDDPAQWRIARIGLSGGGARTVLL